MEEGAMEEGAVEAVILKYLVFQKMWNIGFLKDSMYIL